MFTFTKTITSDVAYVVEWGTGKRQDGIGPKVATFETLEEARQFCRNNKDLYTATITKKVFIEEFRQGQQYEDVRDSITTSYEENMKNK